MSRVVCVVSKESFKKKLSSGPLTFVSLYICLDFEAICLAALSQVSKQIATIKTIIIILFIFYEKILFYQDLNMKQQLK